MFLSNACLFALLVALLTLAAGSHVGAQQSGGGSVFDPRLFADPPNEYRPLQMVHGFDRMLRDRQQLAGEKGIDARLEFLQGLGIGGIVANVGRDDYLNSRQQWEVYRYGMQKAHEMGLVLWLYDEKGYPSGTAGGIVTRANPQYVAQGLACYTLHVQGPTHVTKHLPLSCKTFEWACAYPSTDQPAGESVLDLSDEVDDWGTLRWDAPDGDWTVLYIARRIMYEGTFATAVPIGHTPTRQYINTLDKDAVRAFLRVTHEQYARETPPELWQEVRAIFTDEPLIAYHCTGGDPEEREADARVLDKPFFTDRPPAAPWVHELPGEFRRRKGYELRPHLYALFTSGTPEARYVRQDFWDVVTDMYAQAYFAQIADWCAEHGTAMSGHVLAEENLWGNMMFEGSLTAVVRRMQIPGIDILTADPEAISDHVFMAGKTVSSVAHLTGKRTVHCECCAFRPLPSGERLGLDEFIAQANMLQVMGVNLFTLYQNHRQIGEEAFRRYTDYVGRLSLLLRGGRHVCDVAVLYPIRSAWSCWAPAGRGEAPEPETAGLDRQFSALATEYVATCRELAQHQIDFDIVDERALQEAQMRDGAMRIADEGYRVIVLPLPYALELATARALRDFCEAGGVLISVAQPPELADSARNQPAFDDIMADLFAEGGPCPVLGPTEVAGWIRQRLGADLELAEPNRRVFYTHRRREQRDLYFIVNNGAQPVTLRPRLRVAGPYTVYRPLTGAAEPFGQESELALNGYEGAFLVTCGPR